MNAESITIFVYPVMMILSAIPVAMGSYFCNKKKLSEATCRKYKIAGFAVSALIAFLLLGFRVNISTGFAETYLLKWYQYNNGMKQGLTLTPFMQVLFFLLSKVTREQQWITIICSLLMIVPLWTSIYVCSPLPAVSILLFVGLRHIFLSMNFLEYGVAMAFLSVAFVFVKKENLWMYMLFIALAAFFYFPAIVFLPLYFLKNKKVDSFYWVLIVAVVSVIIRVVVLLTEHTDEASEYITKYFNIYTSTVFFELLFTIIMIIIVCRSNKQLNSNDDKLSNYFFNLNLLNALILINGELINIPETYVWMFSCCNIIFIPMIINKLNSLREKIVAYCLVSSIGMYLLINVNGILNRFSGRPYISWFFN